MVAAGDAGRVGAEVVDVGHLVAVVVGIGAAVLVLPAVEVLRLVGAFVGSVGDAVAVVVGIGAAVVVEVAVLVLGLVGALVAGVGDAVAVGVLVGQGGDLDELARGAAIGRAVLEGGLRVGLGLAEVPLGQQLLALVEVDGGKFQLAARDGQLARRAPHRAVLLGVVHGRAQPPDAPAHDRSLGARAGEQRDQHERGKARAHGRVRRALCASSMAFCAYSSAVSARFAASE